MEEVLRIAILAAGDFPIHWRPIQALREAFFIICCDGAYRAFRNSAFNHQEFVVIGDGDSLTADEKRELGDRYIPVAEQEYNDLHKALTWVVSHFPPDTTHVTIVGATGRREDHTLGNLAHLADFASQLPLIEMLTDHGRFTVTHETRHFQSHNGQQVSLFAMTPDTEVSTEGLRWPIEGRKLPRWWQGTLNQALGDHFSVCGRQVLVFQAYNAV